ncbi:hypothetical protein Hanom_Chr12g01068051 [Helianthus anomalus]
MPPVVAEEGEGGACERPQLLLSSCCCCCSIQMALALHSMLQNGLSPLYMYTSLPSSLLLHSWQHLRKSSPFTSTLASTGDMSNTHLVLFPFPSYELLFGMCRVTIVYSSSSSSSSSSGSSPRAATIPSPTPPPTLSPPLGDTSIFKSKGLLGLLPPASTRCPLVTSFPITARLFLPALMFGITRLTVSV